MRGCDEDSDWNGCDYFYYVMYHYTTTFLVDILTVKVIFKKIYPITLIN